jgi:hypothetical protein
VMFCVKFYAASTQNHQSLATLDRLVNITAV